MRKLGTIANMQRPKATVIISGFKMISERISSRQYGQRIWTGLYQRKSTFSRKQWLQVHC